MGTNLLIYLADLVLRTVLERHDGVMVRVIMVDLV